MVLDRICPIKFLEDFKGVLHADVYSAYEKMDESSKYAITWVACWVHARRNLEKSETPEIFRIEILREMKHLFMYEGVAWTKKAEGRLKIREEKEKPIVNKIFKMFRDKIKDNTLLPSSNFAKAIGYMLSREKNFRVYLSEPFARMDNNTAERGVRKLVIGRKNWCLSEVQEAEKLWPTCYRSCKAAELWELILRVISKTYSNACRDTHIKI